MGMLMKSLEQVRAPASWVIREIATKSVIAETFDKRKVDALNVAKYEAIPIGQYLASLNGPRVILGVN